MKRAKLLLALVFVALAAVSAWRASLPREPEPLYKGKPLSFYLQAYLRSNDLRPFPSSSSIGVPTTQEADEALRQVGTNAIPTLLRMVRAQDSAWKLKLIAIAQRLTFIKIDHVDADALNYHGALCLMKLGRQAQSAVPALIDIINHSTSVHSQIWAMYALVAIWSPAKEDVPTLLRWATYAESHVRYQAIRMLGRLHVEADQVVPALTSALRDPDADVRDEAVEALRRFGSNARPAVSALVKVLHDPSKAVRQDATNALKAIDPEAAAKAGITNAP
jgi:hypothetical protein